MKNNLYKKNLLNYLLVNTNLVSYKELDTNNLETSDFKFTIKTNNNVKHVFIVDYHLNIKQYYTKTLRRETRGGILLNLNNSKLDLTKHSFTVISNIIDYIHSIR